MPSAPPLISTGVRGAPALEQGLTRAHKKGKTTALTVVSVGLISLAKECTRNERETQEDAWPFPRTSSRALMPELEAVGIEPTRSRLSGQPSH